MENLLIQRLDTALRKDALTGIDNECGDTGLLLEDKNRLFLALIDALGHGKEAYDTAMKAEEYLRENQSENLKDLLLNLHKHMLNSRGLVIAVCWIYPGKERIRYAGIGNISTKIFGHKKISFVPRDGVVGFNMPTPREQEADFAPGDLLILNSDGLNEHFSPLRNPELQLGTAADTAAFLFSNFRRDDDASCIVVRNRR
jgi:phosphoserine phosphatase RsbX